MTLQEAIYWDGEISDAEIDTLADTGNLYLAAEQLMKEMGV